MAKRSVIRNVWILAVPLLLTACAVSSPITRETTTMTPAEIAEMGLICRTQTPANSSIPQSVCASEKAWAAFDRQTGRATQDFFAEGRSGANTGRFIR